MSEVKVNKISPRSGTEVTLGDSGDTFTIPSGATINNQGTATNFGATGSASWNTTVKTGDFTAVAGEGYFVNTTSGEIDVTLPAGTAGDVIAIKDYAKTFDTNNCILVRNGSDKIGGQAINATLTIEGIAVTLVFVDSTQGWLVTDSGLQDEAPTPQFLTATGGTITTVCTDYKVHTFTGPGTFTVCSVGNPAGSDSIDYLVIAGGGAGGRGPNGANMGAGGGAGGYRESSGTVGSFSASPLGACVAALPVSVTGYPITVGAGGVSPNVIGCRGDTGSNSIFSSITSAGGGGGGAQAPTNATNGGSGGGSAGGIPCGGTVGVGNTPPVSPPQGNPGGLGGGSSPAGGGGGATAAGGNGTGPTGGPGGAGATSSINGTPTGRGGGGGGNGTPTCGTAGPGGGGGSGSPGGGNGTVNTGGGGAGTHFPYVAGNGGSGVVIIRYKFQ